MELQTKKHERLTKSQTYRQPSSSGTRLSLAPSMNIIGPRTPAMCAIGDTDQNLAKSSALGSALKRLRPSCKAQMKATGWAVAAEQQHCETNWLRSSALGSALKRLRLLLQGKAQRITEENSRTTALEQP
jgi:hypothetical protein